MDGDNGNPADAFPLAECSGDCDNSDQCFGDLACFQRDGSMMVPGCIGTGVSAKDYCYKPNGDRVVAFVGDNGFPARSFPLGECEGDCDADADCTGDLLCLQRSGTEPIPGCMGVGKSAKDYCYDISKLSPPTSRPSNPPTITTSPTGPWKETYFPGDLTVTKSEYVARTIRDHLFRRSTFSPAISTIIEYAANMGGL